jgi:hypothetical protein
MSINNTLSNASFLINGKLNVFTGNFGNGTINARSNISTSGNLLVNNNGIIFSNNACSLNNNLLLTTSTISSIININRNTTLSGNLTLPNNGTNINVKSNINVSGNLNTNNISNFSNSNLILTTVDTGIINIKKNITSSGNINMPTSGTNLSLKGNITVSGNINISNTLSSLSNNLILNTLNILSTIQSTKATDFSLPYSAIATSSGTLTINSAFTQTLFTPTLSSSIQTIPVGVSNMVLPDTRITIRKTGAYRVYAGVYVNSASGAVVFYVSNGITPFNITLSERIPTPTKSDRYVSGEIVLPSVASGITLRMLLSTNRVPLVIGGGPSPEFATIFSAQYLGNTPT